MIKDNNKSKKIRVLMGFTEIAGYLDNLHQELKKEDLQIDFVMLDKALNYETYSGITSLPILVTRYMIRRRAHTRGLKRLFYLLATEFCKSILFIEALFRYDVFLFNAKKSFFRFNLDLPLLRLFGKKIIFNLSFGSDSRPVYCNGKFAEFDVKKMISSTKSHSRSISWIEFFSNIVIANSTHAHFFNQPFVDISNFPSPPVKMDLIEQAMHEQDYESIFKNNNDKIKILHAPSNRAFKGSNNIKDAVISLQNQGYLLEYIETENMPHQMLLRSIFEADIVIDQIYTDYMMPVLSTECAWLKTPVINAGYIYADPYFKNIFPKDMPIQASLPSDFIQSLKSLLDSSTLRDELKERAYAYVSENKKHAVLVKEYLKIITQHKDSLDLTDPHQCSYIFGGGLSKEALKRNIQAMVNAGGFEALRLGKKELLLLKYKELLETDE